MGIAVWRLWACSGSDSLVVPVGKKYPWLTTAGNMDCGGLPSRPWIMCHHANNLLISVKEPTVY